VTLLPLSLSLVFALLLGTYVGFRISVSLFGRKLHAAFERMIADPRNRSTVTAGWLLDRIHDRIVEGASLEELHEWIHGEQARTREATRDAMRRAMVEDGVVPP
jgi:hypothetical protein